MVRGGVQYRHLFHAAVKLWENQLIACGLGAGLDVRLYRHLFVSKKHWWFLNVLFPITLSDSNYHNHPVLWILDCQWQRCCFGVASIRLLAVPKGWLKLQEWTLTDNEEKEMDIPGVVSDGGNRSGWTTTEWISSSSVEQTTQYLFFNNVIFKCYLLNKTSPAV